MLGRGTKHHRDRVVGAVLAGGVGRRIGGDKAIVELDARPLIAYPLAALELLGLDQIAVVAKRGTALPELAERHTLWIEPDAPLHPACGLAHALRRADGRWVLACAADLALLDVTTLRTLIAAAERDDLAVVPRAGGRLQPLCALYAPAALKQIACFDPAASLTETVAALDPRVVELEDTTPFFNVNAPEDVLHASVLLRERYPNVKA